MNVLVLLTIGWLGCSCFMAGVVAGEGLGAAGAGPGDGAAGPGLSPTDATTVPPRGLRPR